MNFTICFHVRLFQDTRRNYIGHVNCSNPSIFTFKRGLSKSNLYKLNVVGYFVTVIHKTLKSPPGSINQYVRCVFGVLFVCVFVCFCVSFLSMYFYIFYVLVLPFTAWSSFVSSRTVKRDRQDANQNILKVGMLVYDYIGLKMTHTHVEEFSL